MQYLNCFDIPFQIRRQAIKELPNLCKENKDHLLRIADVLTQLLQSEDSQDLSTVNGALIALFKLDAKGKYLFVCLVSSKVSLLVIYFICILCFFSLSFSFLFVFIEWWIPEWKECWQIHAHLLLFRSYFNCQNFHFLNMERIDGAMKNVKLSEHANWLIVSLPSLYLLSIQRQLLLSLLFEWWVLAVRNILNTCYFL